MVQMGNNINKSFIKFYNDIKEYRFKIFIYFDLITKVRVCIFFLILFFIFIYKFLYKILQKRKLKNQKILNFIKILNIIKNPFLIILPFIEDVLFYLLCYDSKILNIYI